MSAVSMYADDENSITLCIRGISLALDELDAETQIAVDDGDAEELARSFVALHDAKRRLDLIHRTLEEALAEALPSGVSEIPGLPPVERKRGRERKQWQNDRLFDFVQRHALDPDGTGEFPSDPMEAVDRVTRLIREVWSFTPSTNPRITALRSIGVDPDEWCSSQPGRVSVIIHGQAPEVTS